MHKNSNDVVVSVLQEEGIVVAADIIVTDIEAEVEVIAEIGVVGEIVLQIVVVVIVLVLVLIAKNAEETQSPLLVMMSLK